jgi:hypothetical protein
MIKWGFLRETSKQAEEAGLDLDTGLHRTGLNDYLNFIFPFNTDWVHDKALGEINGVKYRTRPDYRSETLKLIIEFDGLPHYTKPDIILNDYRLNKIYSDLGYKVVRIPYFIQLTNKAVKTLFNINIEENLFDESIPSLGVNSFNTPAYLCIAGIKRMASEFKKFPEQYKVNIDFLKSQNNEFLSGVNFLEEEYNKIN